MMVNAVLLPVLVPLLALTLVDFPVFALVTLAPLGSELLVIVLGDGLFAVCG